MTRRTAAMGALLALAGCSLVATAPSAAAADRTCTATWVAPGGGAWATPANWSPPRVPASNASVCLPLSGHPQIRLTAPVTVRTLQVGNARVVLADGLHLAVRYLTLDGSGGISGHGTVGVARSLEAPSGASGTLGGGVAVTTGTADVSGPLRLQQASTLTVQSQIDVVDAALTDDGDPGNLLVAQGLVGYGTSSVTPPARITELTAYTGTLTVPQLIAASDGSGSRQVTVDDATLVVPDPITTVDATTFVSLDYSSSSIVAASTGANALTGITSVAGGLFLATAIRLTEPLTVPGGNLEVDGATVTVPSVAVSGPGAVSVESGGTLHLGTHGTGTLSLQGTAPNAGALVFRDGAVIAGTIDQAAGSITSPPGVTGRSEIHGAWTSGPDAVLTLDATGAASDAGTPTNLLVSRTANLQGTLDFEGNRPSPPVGTSEVLLTATDGLTTHFAHVRATRDWQISTTSTSIVATFLGSGADTVASPTVIG